MTDDTSVAEVQDETGPVQVPAPDRSALEGAGMAQDFFDTYTKALSGNWAEGIVNFAGGVMSIQEFREDPFGKFISMGLGWVIEYFGWLRAPLDWLTGDQLELDRMAATWSGVGDELHRAATDLDEHYRTDTRDWAGATADKYRGYCENHVELYICLSHSAKTISTVTTMCKTVLAVVRTIVRELITDFVGRTISLLARYPPPTTPMALPEAGELAASYSQRILDWVRKAWKALTNAKELLGDVLTKLRGLPAQLRSGMKAVREGANSLGQHAVDAVKKTAKNLRDRHTFAAMYAKDSDSLGDTVADVAQHYARGFTADAVKDVLASPLGRAMGHAAGKAVQELPQKVSDETVKETGKAYGSEIDEDLTDQPGHGVAPGQPADSPRTRDGQESYLAGGQGAHRVSGDLEEP
ncbi:hypothetical protein [Actinophytocola sp.]|uniref:hypothetical protein n=1 Tax=Actinophytocola sp. TaxID=1872138 RepID=UPI002D4AB2CC|nr:hypothetical protein [Actinophytocola sp.]HYQ65894.1 hypothetical protein [Actinophytocola sp.]